ncbi:MAG: hypothetical protein FWF77_08100, partial [Defluviitaleaceae bacterium]|nr:hypothetical protein [Defluviitaleaceae bacterium]
KKARQARSGHRRHMLAATHSLEAGNNFLTHKKGSPFLPCPNTTKVQECTHCPFSAPPFVKTSTISRTPNLRVATYVSTSTI